MDAIVTETNNDELKNAGIHKVVFLATQMHTGISQLPTTIPKPISNPKQQDFTKIFTQNYISDPS
jgi:hypothetical protein